MCAAAGRLVSPLHHLSSGHGVARKVWAFIVIAFEAAGVLLTVAHFLELIH